MHLILAWLDYKTKIIIHLQTAVGAAVGAAATVGAPVGASVRANVSPWQYHCVRVCLTKWHFPTVWATWNKKKPLSKCTSILPAASDKVFVRAPAVPVCSIRTSLRRQTHSTLQERVSTRQKWLPASHEQVWLCLARPPELRRAAWRWKFRSAVVYCSILADQLHHKHKMMIAARAQPRLLRV